MHDLRPDHRNTGAKSQRLAFEIGLEFEVLDALQGQVKKITRTAGGIKNRHLAQPFEKFRAWLLSLRHRVVKSAALLQMRRLHKLFCRDPGDLPFGPQRTQDHRLDDHHDLFGVSVMRADLRALVGIKKALEQSPENRRIDLAPVKTCRSNQQADVAVIKPDSSSTIEQTAVEMRDISEVEFTAMLHCLEQRIEIFLRSVRPLSRSLQQLRKEAIRQEFDTICKETEHELVDEVRHFLRRASALQS